MWSLSAVVCSPNQSMKSALSFAPLGHHDEDCQCATPPASDKQYSSVPGPAELGISHTLVLEGGRVQDWNSCRQLPLCPASYLFLSCQLFLVSQSSSVISQVWVPTFATAPGPGDSGFQVPQQSLCSRSCGHWSLKWGSGSHSMSQFKLGPYNEISEIEITTVYS